MKYNNELFQLPLNKLGVLPINYRIMKKLTNKERKCIKIEESEYYQTKAYELKGFYKSIAPCFNF